jgi:hypothetical protein
MSRAGAGSRFLTTLPYTRRPAWTARADIVDPSSLSTRRLVGRLLRSASRYDALVLNGSVRADQLAAALLARSRRPPVTVLVDATWKAGDGALGARARRAAVRALDHGDAHYCVLSTEEARAFGACWGVPAERVHFTPFHWVLDERDVEEIPARSGGVFAGGDSLRDYAPLIAAAEGLPARVTIASRRERGPVPPNVALGALERPRYDELFREATVVVVPLESRGDRSAGQQTYLNAMALEKPVVVTDALGVRDYVEDGVTGFLVPPGDSGALRERLLWILDPANEAEVHAVAERGRRAALERFGPTAYVERLLDVVDRALRARQAERA